MDYRPFDPRTPGGHPPSGWLMPPAPASVPYAGFWRRFAATVLDAIVLGILVQLLGIPLAPALDRLASAMGRSGSDWLTLIGWLVANLGLFVVVDWLYYATLESSSRRATLGKLVLGIAVTDLGGGRISFARASGRHAARFLSAAVFLVGYLIQPFTRRRQALHDLVAGTLVVMKPRHASGAAGSWAAPVPVADPGSGVPGWAKGLLAGAVVALVGCAALGYFVVAPEVQELAENGEAAVAGAIEETVAAAVRSRIPAGPARAGDLLISSAHLDINNTQGPADEYGVSWGTDGTFVYGFETRIGAAAISVGAGAETMVALVPSVVDGRLELSPVEGSVGAPGLGITAGAFEAGLEAGINRALEAGRLTATEVTLGEGMLTIAVVPSRSAPRGPTTTPRSTTVDESSSAS